MPSANALRLLFVLVAGLVATGASSTLAQDAMVPKQQAVDELTDLQGIVNRRFQQADDLYEFYDPARATLRAAFAKAGISGEITERFADTWANNGLASDFTDAARDVYHFPLGELTASVNHAINFPVRRDEFDGIKRGMNTWMTYEKGFRALLAERVQLYVDVAAAAEMLDAAAAISCGEVESCLAAKAATTAAAQLKERIATAALGSNRDALAKTRDHFFVRLKSTTPPPCQELRLGFVPPEVTVRKPAQAMVELKPVGCDIRDDALKLRIVTSEGPTFTLGPSGMVSIDKNVDGFALFEVTHKTQEADLLALGELTAAVIPPDCTGIQFDPAIKRLRVHGDALLPIALTPHPCTPPEDPIIVTAKPANILWAGPFLDLQSVAAYPRNLGKATVTIRLGSLGATSHEIEVYDIDEADCEQLTIKYRPQTLRVGAAMSVDEASGLAPSYSFGPEPCRHPTGLPNFQSLHDTAKVGPQTGVVFPAKPGPATIAVEWGGLSATTDLKIVDQPVCDGIELKYNTTTLAVGKSTAPPTVRYFSRREVTPNAEACAKPFGRPVYSVFNDGVVSVDPGTGIATGLATGRTVVSVDHEAAFDSEEITVD